MTTRNPRNRIKNWTGTVHYADERGAIACGPVKTAATWLAWTIEDVNCSRCIAQFGSDEPTQLKDPAPSHHADEHAARRAAERSARRAG